MQRVSEVEVGNSPALMLSFKVAEREREGGREEITSALITFPYFDSSTFSISRCNVPIKRLIKSRRREKIIMSLSILN